MRPLFAALMLVACLLSFSSSAHAQTPSPDDTLRAFRIAEKHIRDWRMPPDPASKEPENTETPKAVGACITLKLRGEVIGRGAAWSDVIAGPEAFSREVLRRAILVAMQQADSKLGVPNDAMRDAAIKLVTPDILISVELAGPLSVVEFNTWEDAELTLRPGLDGVASRIGAEAGAKQGTLHAIFPSQMMLGNMLPHRAMGAVAARAIGEGGAAAALDDPKKLRESSGVRMYRFRVGQAVQSTSASAHVQYRGARTIGTSEIAGVAELRLFAERLTSHLSPWLDQAGKDDVALSRPENLRSVTIAAAAIWEYADLVGNDRIREAPRMVAFGGPPKKPQSTDAAVLAEWRAQCSFLIALAHGGEMCANPLFAGLAEVWDGAKPNSDFSNPAYLDDCAPSAKAYCQSLFVKSPGLQGRSNSDGAIQTLDRSVRAFWNDHAGRSVIAELPWLGWTEIAIADAKSKGRSDRAADIPTALAIRKAREDCWKHQLSITEATEDTLDMAGGIIFTAGDGKGGGNPYPTWQCVRPLAFIATMLRDPRLTEPNERSEQIVRLMQAARFLRQLQVDEASAWMYPDPKLAIGGIRASTWDNSLPVDATSMTLLFVVELIKSLDELSAAKPTPAPAAAPAAQPARISPATLK